MKLYLVRHGQTDWNVKKCIQGIHDIELNSTGIAQAEALRDEIKRRGIKFDHVYASPLRRAQKTAEIITDGQYPILSDRRLTERNFGDIEGKLINPLDEGIDIYDLRSNTNAYNIEPVKEVFARTKSFLDDLYARHKNSDTILIVAHGALLRVMNFNIVGYDDDVNIHAFHFDNCQMREYDVDIDKNN